MEQAPTLTHESPLMSLHDAELQTHRGSAQGDQGRHRRAPRRCNNPCKTQSETRCEAVSRSSYSSVRAERARTTKIESGVRLERRNITAPRPSSAGLLPSQVADSQIHTSESHETSAAAPSLLWFVSVVLRVFRSTEIDGTVVLNLEGQLRGQWVAELRDLCSKHLLRPATRLVLDPPRSSFIDADGLELPPPTAFSTRQPEQLLPVRGAAAQGD